MAANPNPARITAAQWWFIEQLQALEPVDTVFAGAWGNFKPGYHCDRNTLLATPAWRNDYSIQLAADKRGPGQYGAANDWTFRSAQRGDFNNISKYGGRIAAAHKARDPRLKGWREVLIQADMDKAPEGFDFQSWTTRVPDDTHSWHGHFSELRENVESFDNKRAMLSVLRGEPNLGVGDDMFFFQTEDLSAGRMNGCTYEFAPDFPTLLKWQAAWPGAITKKIKRTDLDAGVYGVNMSKLINTPAPAPGPGDGVTEAQVHEIVHLELEGARIVPGE
jgi:hypothetical protein